MGMVGMERGDLRGARYEVHGNARVAMIEGARGK